MERQLGFLWQECPGGARLLKVYGDTPCPALPERIGGLPLREIGPYCFAEKPVPAGTLTLPAGMDAAQLHAICGNFVESVTLPDSVHLLDRAAFYNCRSLHRVELGAGIDALGSDLFTNCRALACLAVRAEPDATTGLRKLLGGGSIYGAVTRDAQVGAQGSAEMMNIYPRDVLAEARRLQVPIPQLAALAPVFR